jgi:hypothetical protein
MSLRARIIALFCALALGSRLEPDDPRGYSLSPDGRYVAYAAEISRGSSIWRVDLGDVLTAGGESRRR